MDRWIVGYHALHDSHATHLQCRRCCVPHNPYTNVAIIFQGAVSGEDVYIREGMAALAGWQGAACTASSMEVKAQKKTYELLR